MSIHADLLVLAKEWESLSNGLGMYGQGEEDERKRCIKELRALAAKYEGGASGLREAVDAEMERFKFGLPSGDVSAWMMIKVVKEHCDKMDAILAHPASGPSATEEIRDELAAKYEGGASGLRDRIYWAYMDSNSDLCNAMGAGKGYEVADAILALLRHPTSGPSAEQVPTLEQVRGHAPAITQEVYDALVRDAISWRARNPETPKETTGPWHRWPAEKPAQPGHYIVHTRNHVRRNGSGDGIFWYDGRPRSEHPRNARAWDNVEAWMEIPHYEAALAGASEQTRCTCQGSGTNIISTEACSVHGRPVEPAQTPKE